MSLSFTHKNMIYTFIIKNIFINSYFLNKIFFIISMHVLYFMYTSETTLVIIFLQTVNKWADPILSFIYHCVLLLKISLKCFQLEFALFPVITKLITLLWITEGFSWFFCSIVYKMLGILFINLIETWDCPTENS